MVQNCTLGILPNPDIAGVGVRVSIYAQAYLSLIHPILAGLDGRLTTDEIASLHNMYFGILLTACALLISAFIQAATYGLSVYHALIILNLSWINSASAAILPVYVLFDHYGSELPIQARTVWILFNPRALSRIMGSSAHQRGRAKVKQIWAVCLLSSAHLCVMAGLGIWVWKRLDTFGSQPECTSYTFISMLFQDVPVNDGNLRYTSIVIYSLAAVPVANLYVYHILLVGAGIGFILGPISSAMLLYLAFFTLVIWVMVVIDLLRFGRKDIQELIIKSIRRIQSLFRPSMARGDPDTLTTNNFNIDMTTRRKYLKLALFMITPLPIALLQTYFLVCTELMIKRSRKIVAPGESEWTFGQTLAVLLTVMPLLEVRKAVWEALRPRLWRTKASNISSLEEVRKALDIIDASTKPTSSVTELEEMDDLVSSHLKQMKGVVARLLHGSPTSPTLTVAQVADHLFSLRIFLFVGNSEEQYTSEQNYTAIVGVFQHEKFSDAMLQYDVVGEYVGGLPGNVSSDDLKRALDIIASLGPGGQPAPDEHTEDLVSRLRPAQVPDPNKTVTFTTDKPNQIVSLRLFFALADIGADIPAFDKKAGYEVVTAAFQARRRNSNVSDISILSYQDVKAFAAAKLGCVLTGTV